MSTTAGEVERPPGAPLSPPSMTQPDDPAARRLIEHLRERDIACPLCSYNLRNLASPICPECGQPLELRVGATNLRLGAWITCVASTVFTIGIGGFLVMLVLRWGMPPSTMWALVLLGAALANLLVLTSLVTGRTKFLQMPLDRQRLVAGVCVLLNAGVFVYGAVGAT